MCFVYQPIFDEMTDREITAQLKNSIKAAVYSKYGPSLDPNIEKRIRDEWAVIEASDGVLDLAIAFEIVTSLRNCSLPFWMRATSGSGFIPCLLRMTFSNPLPPHYYCPRCRRVEWVNGYADGFDLPSNAVCEKDGAIMRGDGHNIPWQSHWGMDNRAAYYDIDVPSSVFINLYTALQRHWSKKLSAEKEPFCVRDGMGQFIIKLSHISAACILSNKTVDYGSLPEVNISDASEILNDDSQADEVLLSCRADSFADVVAKLGLHHSAGGWDNDVFELLKSRNLHLFNLIAHRDDVFFYLRSHGFSDKEAWEGMERVRLGKGLPKITVEMSQSADNWVIDCCSKIEYLFPKAHDLEYVFFRARMK